MNPQTELPEHHQSILELHRQGWTQTRIAATTGFSRRTVYNHVHQRVFQPGKHRGRPRGSRKLQPYIPLVHARIEANPQGKIMRLYMELRDLGYTGGLSILRDYCRSLRSFA